MITRGQVWNNGLHLEWMQRGTWMQFSDDVDMSSEIDELERAVNRLMCGRWKISLATEKEDE